MKTYVSICLVGFFLRCIHECSANAKGNPEPYIVYMGKHSLSKSKIVISSNHEMLASVLGSVHHARNATIHHYHKSFRGFSAMLTKEQADEIAKRDSVVSVFKSKTYELQTTRSWEFMQATGDSIFNHYSVQQDYDVIVGHIDSGVWPESPSFNPNGMGPVPRRFKGECVTGDRFSASNCNRKLIGARYYYRGYEESSGRLESSGRPFFRSARDDLGHGTHTASTAVGGLVRASTVIGEGTVRGGACRARLAVYKVCWFNKCAEVDVLKAFDDAIHDKVDIITISAGLYPTNDYSYLQDGYSIGAFHAFMAGILTSAGAGNSGALGPSAVTNSAPWTLTVAASSDDRDFVSNLQLGSGQILQGYGKNGQEMNGFYYLISGSNAARSGVPAQEASFCKSNTLDSNIIGGKVVACLMEAWNDNKQMKSEAVRYGGGVGMILVDPNDEKAFMDHVIPTSVINNEEAYKLGNYMASVREPTVMLLSSVVNYNSKPAPKVAFFSSRGPDRTTPEIIKPDITAPGVNILASWPVSTGPADAPMFVFESGTSMSCPHVSGVAAVIKGLNPDWSPAEIKSALMTTALQVDNTGQPIQSNTGIATPFDLGSGHMNPNSALNPGLVYDMNADDVFYFLCSRSVDVSILQMLFETSRVNCPSPQRGAYELNLPSIGINNLVGGVSVTRRVTYRGKDNDPKVFNVKVENPEGISVEVHPSVLDFSGDQKTQTFRVDIQATKGFGQFVFGSLTWFNDVYRVRSPIAVQAVVN